MVVDTSLVLGEPDDDCPPLLFVEKPGFRRGIRQGDEDDEAGENSYSSVDEKDVLVPNVKCSPLLFHAALFTDLPRGQRSLYVTNGIRQDTTKHTSKSVVPQCRPQGLLLATVPRRVED